MWEGGHRFIYIYETQSEKYPRRKHTFHASFHPTEPLLGDRPLSHFDLCCQDSGGGDGDATPQTCMSTGPWDHLEEEMQCLSCGCHKIAFSL